MAPRILSIGRFDCLAVGGLQNDLITTCLLGGVGASVATSMTAHDTDTAFEVVELPATFIVRQLDQVFQAGRVDAIKIGRLSSEEQIEVVAGTLEERAVTAPVVLAAGLLRENGSPVLGPRALAHWKRRLPQLARLLVASRSEAELLGGFGPGDIDTDEHVAAMLGTLGSEAVLLSTSAPLGGTGLDVLSDGDGVTKQRFEQGDWPEQYRSRPAFATAIAVGLGAGLPLARAVDEARAYVQGARQTEKVS
jgi:hydroxymethylpyrimidine/phosphomethylpyrimidine kinase